MKWMTQMIVMIVAAMASYGTARVENEHRLTLVEERVAGLRDAMLQIQSTTKDIQAMIYQLDPKMYRPEVREKVRKWQAEMPDGMP